MDLAVCCAAESASLIDGGDVAEHPNAGSSNAAVEDSFFMSVEGSDESETPTVLNSTPTSSISNDISRPNDISLTPDLIGTLVGRCLHPYSEDVELCQRWPQLLIRINENDIGPNLVKSMQHNAFHLRMKTRLDPENEFGTRNKNPLRVVLV